MNFFEKKNVVITGASRGIGLSIATTSIVANSIGEKNISKASQIFCQSLGLAIFVGIIISIFGIFFGPSILESINNNKQTLKLSSDYMNIIYLDNFLFQLLNNL